MRATRTIPIVMPYAILRRQRIDVRHAGEAAEVVVGGGDRTAVFNRERGEMRIGGQVARGPAGGQQVAQDRPVLFARTDQLHEGLTQPAVDVAEGALGAERLAHDPRMRSDAHERERRDPRYGDRFGSRKRLLQPPAWRSMCG